MIFMPRSVFFDTQIPTQVNDGSIPAKDWNALLTRMSGVYEYRVSLNTFLELLNALEGGDESHFEHNRKRLLVLTDPGCKFLPLTPDFIRQSVLGLPLERQEFSPRMLQEQWLPVLKASRNRDELVKSIPLQVIRSEIEGGKKLWAEVLQLATDSSEKMPSKDTYAKFHLRYFAHADITTENIKKVGDALDAAYCHLAYIHHEGTTSCYKFATYAQDRIDNQQLVYLADSECTFVTADQKLIAKLDQSTRRRQVRHFKEFCQNL
jgi:hypothetical protein